jgi:hypothetical protein
MSAGVVDAAAKGLGENSSLTRVDMSPSEASEAPDASMLNTALGNFAEALRSNTTLLTLNLGHYIGNPHASQTAGSIQSTLMLNARLAGMEVSPKQNPGPPTNPSALTPSFTCRASAPR